jgi:hypothetical protein
MSSAACLAELRPQGRRVVGAARHLFAHECVPSPLWGRECPSSRGFVARRRASLERRCGPTPPSVRAYPHRDRGTLPLNPDRQFIPLFCSGLLAPGAATTVAEDRERRPRLESPSPCGPPPIPLAYRGTEYNLYAYKFSRKGGIMRRGVRLTSPEAKGDRARVPVIGERVKMGLVVAGFSEKHAARLLGERRLAKISQPALNNICTGKTKTCRKSVRDGLATLCGGSITSEWLGGEGSPEQAVAGAEWASRGVSMGAPHLQAAMLTHALARAWHFDEAAEDFPFDDIFSSLSIVLDPTFGRLLAASRLGVPLGSVPTEEQKAEYAECLAKALFVLLEDWLEGEKPTDWGPLLAAGTWVKSELAAKLAQLQAELTRRRGAGAASST